MPSHVLELILSLQPSYDSLVNRLQLVEHGLTMKLLTSRLLLEEQKQKERAVSTSALSMYSAKARVVSSSCSGKVKSNCGKDQRSKTGKVVSNMVTWATLKGKSRQK